MEYTVKGHRALCDESRIFCLFTEASAPALSGAFFVLFVVKNSFPNPPVLSNP